MEFVHIARLLCIILPIESTMLSIVDSTVESSVVEGLEVTMGRVVLSYCLNSEINIKIDRLYPDSAALPAGVGHYRMQNCIVNRK